MEQHDLDDYIYLGTQIRYLQDASEGTPANDDDCIVDNIDYLFDYLREMGLKVTLATDAATMLRDIQRELRDSGDGHELSGHQAREVRTAASRLRDTLMAEAISLQAYVVSEKRIDTGKLLNNVSALFAPGVFQHLPDLAQYDYREAGRALAFEIFTGAAFHSLRATEAVLRGLYCGVVKRNRCEPMLWYPMVSELRNRRRRPIVPAALLDDLDGIRRNYRNPTQHPEMTYTGDTAQDLFNACVGVTNRIVTFQLEAGLISPQDA